MHGNTIKAACGFKTRPFDLVLREVREVFAIQNSEGTIPGGVRAVTEENLCDRYHTACDPRLNASQSLERAVLVSEELSDRRAHLAARTG